MLQHLLAVNTYVFATTSGYKVSCVRVLLMTWEQDLDMIYKLYAHPNTADISRNVFRTVGST